jgi:GNAT superfamily N-acetyltransferase
MKIEMKPLTDALKKQVYEGFSRHAIAMTGHDEKGEGIAFIATDAGEEGSFAGAIVVELFWGALHIKYLFVEDAYRNRGIASRLMQQALEFGHKHRSPFTYVETMSFQALGFYQKMGFKLEFTRSGFNHGSSMHYLRKDLTDS